ncbi:MAG: hypothetical protein V1848_00400, partial [Candidatus Magasanikbacteria bacterium]
TTIGQRDDIEIGKTQEENDWKKQLKAVEPRDPGSEYDTDEHAFPKSEPVGPPREIGVESAREARRGHGTDKSGPTRLWKRLMGKFRRDRKNIAE